MGIKTVDAAIRSETVTRCWCCEKIYKCMINSVVIQCSHGPKNRAFCIIKMVATRETKGLCPRCKVVT